MLSRKETLSLQRFPMVLERLITLANQGLKSKKNPKKINRDQGKTVLQRIQVAQT